MIAAAKLVYMNQHNPRSERPATTQLKPEDMRIYPEMELTVEVDDPNHPTKGGLRIRFEVVGRVETQPKQIDQ
jgi:hypothetical protein